MKSDYIYFGDLGLTSTSANHVANMTKESVQKTINDLDAVSFYGTTVSLLSGGTPQQAKIGSKREELDDIQRSLEAIGEANSLCAWLREAIKARDRLLAEVKSTTLERYCKDILGGVDVPNPDTNITSWMKEKGYAQPDINGDFLDVETPIAVRFSTASRIGKMCKKFNLTMPTEPSMEAPITEDEYMSTLSVKERNRFLMLEAKAASIGKFIHENGHLYQERETLRKVIANPIRTNGEGENTLIYRFEPSVSLNDVDSMFFRLAAEHRAIQAELNGLLAERSRIIEADKQEKAARYQNACDEFNREMSVLQDKLNAYMFEECKKMSTIQSEYDAWSTQQKNRHKELSAELAAWKLSESKRIANIGIIIPNELRDIYDRVNGLGK